MRPGPATSAKAPRACALKALNMHEEVSVKDVTKNAHRNTFNNLRRRRIRKGKMDQLGQNMRQNSSSPDTDRKMQ